MRRMMATMLTLALVFVACGDDDSGDSDAAAGGENSQLISSLSAKIVADAEDDDEFQFTDEQAACFAVGLIDVFGAERIAETLQMDFDDFMAQASAGERAAVVDTMLGCADFGQVLTQEFAGSISQESSRCLADAFVNSEAFRAAMADSFADSTVDPFDDPALAAEMVPAMLECLTADELIQIGSDS